MMKRGGVVFVVFIVVAALSGCATTAANGTANAPPMVNTGLTVAISGLPEVACDGDEGRFTVSVSEPAHLRVYSLAEDGTALLGWAPPDVVARSITEATLHVSLSSTDTHDTLVVVAVPAGWGLEGFGALRPSEQMCLARGVKVVDLVARAPRGAAIATASVWVMKRDGRCPANHQASERVEIVQYNIIHLPLCSVSE